MILLINQFQKIGRAFRIWKTLIILLLTLWFDSKKWTYLKGYNLKRKERRQVLRAKWLTKELVELGSAFIKLGQLLSARAYVIPLGGKNGEESVSILTQFSHLVRKALSKKVSMKFLPKIYFIYDMSFDYAEKIERLIQKNR